jgi:hypothetical protein
MFYKLLGWTVWNGGKTYLRRKNGPTYVPKQALAGGAVLVAGAVALIVAGAARRNGSD